jgi:hypothetical protein
MAGLGETVTGYGKEIAGLLQRRLEGLYNNQKGQLGGRPGKDEIGKCAWVSRFGLWSYAMGFGWARLMPILRSRLVREAFSSLLTILR